jgi:short-subunit dehydrogenase
MYNFEGKLAVITGASSGLGMGFAEALAKRGCNLVLVARTQSKLINLQQRLSQDTGATIDIVPLDLARPDAPLYLYRTIKEKGLSADFLINSAGLGHVGPFMGAPLEKDEAMIALNISALHHLMKLFLKDMIAGDCGRILNVASTAGFQPMPFFAAYAATKSYVLNLSEALNRELSKTNVRVSALCPGPTRTAFWDTAGSKGTWFTDLVMMENQKVVDYGIKLMLSGRPSGIPGIMNKLMVYGNRFVPWSLAAKITATAMKE